MHEKPLPARTQVVADVIGRERALYLVGNWPKCYNRHEGARAPQRLSIYIPATLTPDHALVNMLGWQDAEKLHKAFRGEILNLAYCTELFRDHRDASIRRLYGEGNSTAQLAEWFDITPRQVRNIVKEIPREVTIH
ncbi:Mor transcription activator family protein [Dyella sp. 2RAF44]|uniref:Mor transcription activator family protein n=1 Tax=Dyella sp. 2RAF44 TaxID=3233000 RepID=UPI003F93375A